MHAVDHPESHDLLGAGAPTKQFGHRMHPDRVPVRHDILHAQPGHDLQIDAIRRAVCDFDEQEFQRVIVLECSQPAPIDVGHNAVPNR